MIEQTYDEEPQNSTVNLRALNYCDTDSVTSLQMNSQIIEITQIISSEVEEMGFVINFNLRALIEKIVDEINCLDLKKVKQIFKVNVDDDFEMGKFACFRMVLKYLEIGFC